jgi:hypothetical protein
MTRLVEVSPAEIEGVRTAVIATRDHLHQLGSLRWRARELGVPTGDLDDTLAVGDRLTHQVLPTVDTHLRRAQDLADARYGGSMGVCVPVVDDEPWPVPPSPFTTTPALDGGLVIDWAAATPDEVQVDDDDTHESQGIGGWFSDRWDDVSGAVQDGADWVADTAASTWDSILDAGAAIGDWWETTTADLGGWIDEHGAGVREWIGQHVGIIRWFASAFRIVGWIVVAVGVVLTVMLAIVGFLGGGALGAVFGFGAGAVPGGAAGAIAGASFGLKVLGVGFTLVSIGDLLDVAADWGEGKIDGQQLVQQGSLELAFAATSLLGIGVIGKIAQKIIDHLPAGATRQLEEWVESLRRSDDPAVDPVDPVDPVVPGRPKFDPDDESTWPFDLTDPEQVYQHAFHNMDSDEVVLGKFTGPTAPDSYQNVAQSRGAAYFELGTEDGIDLWSAVRDANRFNPRSTLDMAAPDDMFEGLNAPFLDDVIASRKTILFSQDPTVEPVGTYLRMEFDYITKGPFAGLYEWDPSIGPAGGLVPVG